ncbi:nSTAND1 domain-containing NTPase [Nakamurella sp. GG22]
MGIAVLGPLEVDGQGNVLGPRDRVVLSALVVRAGDPISTEALADALWGDNLPASWAKVVQGCVVRLRKRLGAAAIESGAAGYRLTVNEAEVDNRRFERLFERAREAFAGGDPERASYLVREALALWRGRALADLDEWEPGRVEAARLAGLRMDAEELRVEAEIRAGHARDVLEQARALVAQAPLRERRWALLATALHQAGRQAEALAALKQARTRLVDELGLDPGRELVELEQQVLRQDPSLDPVVQREVSAGCPYRGLLPYDSADADSFFGREADVAACLRRLRDSGLLAVVGPSGVGKSSLVRAGVVAALMRSGTPVLVTTPGSRPTESLGELRSRGQQTLVVDQAEEAVTTCPDPAERERYFAALAAHVAAGGALVLSMRADHLGDLAPYPDIARLLEEGLYLLGPMTEPDLRSAIEGPARRAGLRLEPGLVDLLVREVEGEPAALPLLSHVLRATWERREGPTLTVDGYRATGGIRSAVSNSAERLYDAMDASQRSSLRTLLLRLVVPTEDGDPVRARVPRAKVAADDQHRRLVEQLVDARLVSIDGDTVQIAHEALVRVWPRLRGWLDDDVEGQRLFRHLAGAADAWDAMGRPDSELYRGARLGRTVEWRDRADPDLNVIEVAFVDASVALAESEIRAAETRVEHERRVNRRLRGALAGVGVLLVMTLVAGLVAVRSADRAGRERDRAEQAANLADARRAGAQGVLHEKLATGLLLGVEGVRADESAQALENLGAALTRAGALSGVRDVSEMVGRPGTAWMPSVSVSADGTLVAGVVLSEGVRLFDSATLAPLPFLDATGSSGSAAFSPAGEQLAVALMHADDQPLRLYDVPSGKLSQVQPGGIPANSAVAYVDPDDVDVEYSRDGSRIVAELQPSMSGPEPFAHGDTMVWDLADPSRPVFKVRLRNFAHSALSPDGDRLYVVTRGDRPIRAYDVGSARLIASTPSPLVAELGANAVDVSPDGSTLVVAMHGRVLRFDTVNLRQRGPALTGHTALVRDVVFSHDGRLMATSSDDETAVVWDARTGDQLHRFVGGRPLAVAFSADDRTLFTVGVEGLLLAWNVGGRQLALGEDSSAPAEAYSLSLPAPDGHTVARTRSGMLWFENTTTGGISEPRRTRDETFIWSRDAHWLLSIGPDNVVTVWNASDGSVVARSQPFEVNDRSLTAAFSPDAKQVYAHDGTSLVTLSSESMRPVYPEIRVGDFPVLLPHPVDGSVFILNAGGSFYRMNPKTGDVFATATRGLLENEDPDGVMSPDGTRMVVNGPDRRVRLLDVDKQEYVGTDSKTPWGSSPTFAPDGSQFALVQADRIRLWDGRTGEYQASLPLPSRTATFSIVYRPDSTGLVIASTDGRTWTVDTRTHKWVDRACATAGRNLSVEEWEQFFPDKPYESTCPQWPAGT